MTKLNKIHIKNIYYMLSYAFKILQQKNYDKVASESFDNIYDLFAEILVKGLNKQLKQGLYKEYVGKHEHIPTIRGKLVLRESIQNKLQHKQVLACEYDELSEDNLFNQILKVTLIFLLKESSVHKEKKSRIKKIMPYFSTISLIEVDGIKWRRLQFQRNNQNYEMLINICKFIIDGLLLTSDVGNYKTPTFTENNIAALFERFVLEYYRKHYPELNPNAPHVRWNVEDEDPVGLIMLPQMQTEISLSDGDHKLIIDTKFYSQNLNQYGNILSNNLYQIYAYVKNEDTDKTGKVSGLLLYAQTDNNKVLDQSYNMDNNRIGIKTIDLNQDFREIRQTLDEIVAREFGNNS